jgi:hypothetical protein
VNLAILRIAVSFVVNLLALMQEFKKQDMQDGQDDCKIHILSILHILFYSGLSG